jgi:hypothetical protein
MVRIYPIKVASIGIKLVIITSSPVTTIINAPGITNKFDTKK